jgi:hypothetical protein
MNSHLEYIIKQLELEPDLVYNLYPYGSEVYGTVGSQSDRDYIIVYEQKIPEQQLNKNGWFSPKVKKISRYNATLYSPAKFQELLTAHEPAVVECHYLPENAKYENYFFNFYLNLEQLRRSFAAVSSNSWVKCKKKMAQGDNYLGKKSLFHALRLLDYGIQLAENKQIDFRQPHFLNDLTFKAFWEEINSYNSWEELKTQFQSLYNSLKTKFRLVAPIEKNKT